MEEDPSPAEVSHRPLPSVGLPLLRDEIRARRARLVAAGLGAFALLTAATIAGVQGLRHRTPEAEPTPSTSSEISQSERMFPEVAFGTPADNPWGLGGHPLTVEEPTDEEGVGAAAIVAPAPAVVSEERLSGGATRVVRRFGEAPGFRAALVNAGVSDAEAGSIVAALQSHADFRRCRPNHRLVLERRADGQLRRLEYRVSITQVYEAVLRSDGSWGGDAVDVPIERTRIARGGVVETSMGDALEAAHLRRALVGRFVEIFGQHVNFTTDTRRGDRFRIIVDEEAVDGTFLHYGRVHAIELEGGRIGHRVAIWFEPSEAMAGFYTEEGRAVHGGWLRTPLEYDQISSPFDPNRFHPILRRVVPHNGVDYAAATGTPVRSAADGEVTFVGERGPNGNLVIVRHENGYETLYAHLSRFADGLRAGQRVPQGNLVGYVGSTGRSTGPHLHFGLRRRGRFEDPIAAINGPGRLLPARYRSRFRTQLRAMRAELAAIATTPVGGEASGG